MGLGELEVADGVSDDERSFVVTDDDRCLSVDVKLGEMEASHGFQLLDNWARNRVLHPDKTHVAVLVTETVGERYRTTLETLAEHLPLVVVELQVWRGDKEAIVVPHVALASDQVDLSATPAAKAAEAIAKFEAEVVATEEVEEVEEVEGEEALADAEAMAEADAIAEAESGAEAPENKDDTGVADPWGLPTADAEAVGTDSNGAREFSAVG